MIFKILIVSGLGVLFHFLYDWSGQKKFVGIFTSINESTWEHLKLLFFPMLLVTLGEIFICKKKAKDILPGRTIGIVSGMLFIIVIFYSFWGITGRLIDFVNIGIYFLAVIFAFTVEKKKTMDLSICISTLVGITLLFIIFSFHSPATGIFYDLSLHPKD